MRLKINEIYHSLQGESSFAGSPCVFVRTMGCSLRCRWCDTAYAFHQGGELTLDEILARVQSYHCPLVEVTGGEPLDQKNTPELLRRLCDQGYTVLMETGGHRSIAEVDPRVHCIVDVKCPSSKMSKFNEWENLKLVRKKDEVKFVIANREDYAWAKQIVQEHQLTELTRPLFSPVYGEMQPHLLAQWMLEDQLAVRFQIQLHKYLWGSEAQGV